MVWLGLVFCTTNRRGVRDMSGQPQSKDATPVVLLAANGNMLGQRTSTFEVRRAVWAEKKEAEAADKQGVVNQGDGDTQNK